MRALLASGLQHAGAAHQHGAAEQAIKCDSVGFKECVHRFNLLSGGTSNCNSESEAVGAALVEEFAGEFAGGNAGVLEDAVRMMANFVVEGHAAKLAPASHREEFVDSC